MKTRSPYRYKYIFLFNFVYITNISQKKKKLSVIFFVVHCIYTHSNVFKHTYTINYAQMLITYGQN